MTEWVLYSVYVYMSLQLFLTSQQMKQTKNATNKIFYAFAYFFSFSFFFLHFSLRLLTTCTDAVYQEHLRGPISKYMYVYAPGT